MKSILKCALVTTVISIVFISCAADNALSQRSIPADVTYQTFYDDLTPYGTWIDYPGYGHVWTPRIEGDFRPYATNGHWLFSEEGWVWASDYNWGWAPFHYGRWLYDDMYGWLWIPGYDWSPAWVTWGSVDDFYCWAPLPPGMNAGSQFESWRPHSFYWNACSREHIYDRHLAASLERPAQITTIASRIKIINNFTTTKTHNLYYSKGPDVHEVEKYANHRITQTSIKNVNKISQAKHTENTMHVYRPVIQDPKETVQQRPHQILQPKEFRTAEVRQSRPISTEEQRPVRQRSEQIVNLERLPLHQPIELSHASGSGGGRRRGRN